MARFRISKLGLALALTFMLAAAALFALHLRALNTTSYDPGNSALFFFLLTLPWAYLLPDWVVSAEWWPDASYYVGWSFVSFNALLLYCIGGGLALGRRADASPKRRAPRPDPHAVRDG
jgi:hypothetical protein